MPNKTLLEKTLFGVYVFVILASIALVFTSIYVGEEWSRNMQIIIPVLPFFISIAVTVFVSLMYKYKFLTWGLDAKSEH
jgi:hypothetical protein